MPSAHQLIPVLLLLVDMQEFFDTAVFDMPRSQVIDKLCKLAEETETAKAEEMRPLISMVTNTDKKNPGTPMNQVCCPAAATIAASPVCMLLGMIITAQAFRLLMQDELNPVSVDRVRFV